MDQDTSPSQRARYHELLRQQSPGARLKKAALLSQTVRELAIVGIRQRHPRASEEEVKARLVVRLYGVAVARRLQLSVPDDAV
ncbi:MAG: hypothetical protein ACKVPX_01520 [Myxococcaceae bacterium]